MPQHSRPGHGAGGRHLPGQPDAIGARYLPGPPAAGARHVPRAAGGQDLPARAGAAGGRRLPGRFSAVLGACLALAVAAGCSSATPVPPPSGSPSGPVPTLSSPPPPEPSIAPTPPTPEPGAPTRPVFRDDASPVTATDVAYTWHKGCPVGPARLRRLRMTYWGFDGAPHTGTMIVNAAVVSDVVTVFRKLYDARFPIRQMVPEDAFGGKDPASMAADNTSGFNCRYAVAPGTPSWSVHAYGEAIDVNAVENPYLEGGTVMPLRGAAYVVRSPYRPGMAVPGGILVEAFASVGWKWGGRWAGTPDYQHFSKSGG